MEEAPSSTYQDELEWCIRQLELGLLQHNASSKQVQEAQFTLKVLRSQKAPMVKKRQVMKQVFGDYRQLMTKERQKAERLAKKPMKAQIKHGDSKSSGSVIYKKCMSENSESPRELFTSSDNSFQFNFFPSGCSDALSELPAASASSAAGTDCMSLPETSVSQRHCEKTDPWKKLEVRRHETGNLMATVPGDQESEFAFNFTIPKEDVDSDQWMEFSGKVPLFDHGTTQQEKPSGCRDISAAHVSEVMESNCSGKLQSLVLDPAVTVTGCCKEVSDMVEVSQSSLQKKKKKKQSVEYSDASKKPKPEATLEMPKDTAGFPLTPEEQLKCEVSWCVEQLELGLRRQQSSQKQVNEALHTLKTLRSEKAPLVKKRQMMRAMFGDYRKKMEEERQQQLKLMQTASKSARVVAVMSSTKSKVFRRCMDFSGRNSTLVKSPSCTAVENRVQCTAEATFVFTPAKKEFKFNFF
ncbi:uncharacterized protein LOC122816488 isoform X2 [Protopterus annectens]|uniref:uncharacterized protein LOC122816488 isoform X2 n=1 Tax=Protopterus annectens TaxID=7888 RepID=UPI001CFB77D4|nr:uncharacterized protein LOC122816488 isoform X2 [Protopterus annectens]